VRCITIATKAWLAAWRRELKMGAWLAKLGAGGHEVSLDLDSARPDEQDEQAVAAYEAAEKALEASGKCVSYLESYNGNDELVRKAMANPKNEEIRMGAFRDMFPNIIAIRQFYEMSKQFESATLDICKAMLTEEEATDQIAKHPALAAMLAKLFEAVFVFDWAKMNKPAVQNDFSFYRRELNKISGVDNLPVDDGLASAVSMFVAQANPLLHCLQTVLVVLAKSKPNLAPMLASFVNSCSSSLSTGKFSEENFQTVSLSMVVAILLFDRVDDRGAFPRGGQIELKKALVPLRSWTSHRKDSALSTLQYSSRTFNQAPYSIRKHFS